MKKQYIKITGYTWLAMILILAFGLAGCGGDNQNISAAPTEEKLPTEEPTEDMLPTETPLPTEVPPTESPLPPTETPEPTVPAIPTIESGETEHVVMVGDDERSYLLYIPTGLTDDQVVPVVFVFSGATGTPRETKHLTGFNRIAEKYGFLVIYPATLRGAWNTGDIMTKDTDDYGFIEAMLSELASTVNIDPERIYATGGSNGGEFVYRLACDMSDIFAAVASVASSMSFNSPCEPSRAVSVIHIHGLADESHPFEGGGFSNVTPVQDGIDTWAALNNCPDPVVQEGERRGVEHTVYSPCQDGTAVELYTIENAGHEWKAWSTETIWLFFAEHPMP